MRLFRLQSSRSFRRGCAIMLIAWFGCLGSLHAQADFTWKYDPKLLGSANIYGYATYSVPLAVLALDGTDIPLRATFDTDPRPNPVPSPLGRGWSLNFFSSGLVEVNQSSLRWHRPDGRIFYLVIERGDSSAPKRGPNDPITYRSQRDSWEAIKFPKKRFITLSHKESGAEFIYEDGLLARFCLGNKSAGAKQYSITYNRLRSPARLSVFGSGQPVAEFIYKDSSYAKELKVYDEQQAAKSVTFEYGSFTLNSFDFGPYLSKIADAAVNPLTISYKVDDSLVNWAKFERLVGGHGTTEVSWDAKSGFIKEDSSATYKIENPSLADQGRPLLEKKADKERNQPTKVAGYNWEPEEAKVTRMDRAGKSEFRFYDRSKGISTRIDSKGVKTITYYLLTPGPMYAKVRKIEEIRGKEVKVLERNAYDELGRKVRLIDANGAVSVWEYLNGGGLVRKITDGQVEQELTYQAGRLVNNKTFSGGKLSEYIITYGDSGKTVVFQENGEKRWEKIYKDGIGLERFETFGPTKRLWTYAKDVLARLPASNPKP